MKIIFLLFIFNFPILHAKELLKATPSFTPYEFELLIESLYDTENTDEQITLIGYAKEFQSEFNLYTKENLFFLIKGEIYKTLLEHGQFQVINNFEFNDFFISQLTKKIDAGKYLYTKFNLWFMRSILKDIAPYLEEVPNIQSLPTRELKDFNKKAKYLKFWCFQFNKLSAVEFNALTNSVLWSVLRNLDVYFKTMKKFANLVPQNSTQSFFIFPSTKDIIDEKNLMKTEKETQLKAEAEDLRKRVQIQEEEARKALDELNLKLEQNNVQETPATTPPTTTNEWKPQ